MKLNEDEGDEKDQKLWGTGYFEPLIIKVAPVNRPDLQDKVIEGKMDPRRGIAQLQENWDCNAWHIKCRECGDCPLIEHVERVNKDKSKISEMDLHVAYNNFGDEGLRNILIQLRFPHNIAGPIYIPLCAEEYVCARISEGSIEITGIDVPNSRWIDCYWEIDEFFFITSDNRLEFWLSGLIKKQILVGLIRYVRYLIGPI